MLSELRHKRANRINDGHGVASGLALDGHGYAAPAIEPARDFVVFDAVDYVCDLLQTYRRTIAIGHDQRPKLGRVHELPIRLQRQVRVFAVERTGGRIGISVRDRRRDLIDPDATIR